VRRSWRLIGSGLGVMGTSRGWLTGSAVVILLTALPPAVSAHAPAVVLDVASDPSGEVVVTALADPVQAPYLQLRLVRGTSVAAPYEDLGGIAVAPVPNEGTSTEFTVPSWGLGDVDAVFALLGCSSSDASSCTTLLASETRHVVQTAAASASLEVPAQPVFVPEEQVLVTAHNAGGGVIVATGARSSPETIVATDAPPTVFDGYPPTAGLQTVRVRRCSSSTTDRLYCEPDVATQSISFVSELDVAAVFGSHLPRLTGNPAWHSSHARVTVYGLYPYAHQLSWSLYDSDGDRVVGPVEVSVSSSLDEFDLSPGAEASGPLPAGTYEVRFTGTVTKGERVRTGTGAHAVELVEDPPADVPQVVTAQRVWRPSAGRGQATPRFRVRAYPGSYARGSLRVRNSRGAVVETVDVINPCLLSYPGTCGPHDLWDVDFSDLGTVHWPVGRYAAELVMPDSYGRMMVRDLGAVELQQQVLVRRTVTVRAHPVRGTGHTSVHQVRVPTFRNLDGISEVRASVHTKSRTASRARVDLRIPALSSHWRSRTRLTRAPGWNDLPTVSPSYRRQTRLPGRIVEVRVQGGKVRPRIDRVRLTAWAYVWSSTAR
jgi:hypothetical protein